MTAPVKSVRNLRDGELVVSDNGANTLTLVLDDGNLAWEETKEYLNILDRGVLDHRRDADQQIIPVTFGLKYQYLLSDTGDTTEALSIREVLLKKGAAAAWATVGGAGRPYSVKLTFWVVNPDPAGLDERIVFSNFAVTRIRVAEGDPDAIEISGEDYELEPTITRAAKP